MTIIRSSDELKRLLSDFSFEDIGFKLIQEGDKYIEYYKKRHHRADLYVRLNKHNFESEIYTWDEEKKQGNIKKGTFNIRKQDELLFLLTHGLNQLKVKHAVLKECKIEIGYEPTNVIPGRMTEA